jgi:hypothetical protein
MRIAGGVVTTSLAFVAAAGAQEIQFIDLTLDPQRVALRFPPPVVSPSGKGFGSGGGGGSVGDCAPDIRDPHAAAVYLDDIDGQKINPSQPFLADFRLVNTGRLPISIPVSPHRSDLQPADPSVPFTYLDLGLVVRVRGDIGSTAYVRLYGAEDHNGTIRVLKPGEWIRIKAKLKLDPQPPSCTSLKLQPGFWMHSNRFRATSGSFWEDSTGICMNAIPMPPPTKTVVCQQP